MFAESFQEAEPVMKNLAIPASPAVETTLDGQAIAWPYDPNALFTLYKCSAEHQRCCQIKAEAAFGLGFESFDKKLEQFVPDGASSLFSQVGMDIETYGNGFIEIVRAGTKIVGLRHLPARTMMRTEKGFVQWIYKVDGFLEISYFSSDEVVHFRELCIGGLHYAMPNWIGAHGMIELVFAAIEYNASFFRNRAIPDYAIVVKNGNLGKAAKAQVKEFFQSTYGGIQNQHKALFIPLPTPDSDIQFQKITEDRKDADFLKLLDACRDRIIVAHGVPPRMLGIMSSGQLGGSGEVSGQIEVFDKITLAPKRRRFMEKLQPLFKEMGVTNTITFKPLLESVQLTKSDNQTQQLISILSNI